MKITAVRCFQISGPVSIPPMEERQVGMLDVYPEFAARPVSRQAITRVTGTYVQIDTDEGASGLFGPIFEETGVVVLRKLAAHLIGQDPLSSEKIWDVLY